MTANRNMQRSFRFHQMLGIGLIWLACGTSTATAQATPTVVAPRDLAQYELIPNPPRDARKSLLELPPPGTMPAVDPTPETTDEQRVRLPADVEWFNHIEDNQPIRSEETNENEFRAYNFTIAFARQADPILMERYAQHNVPLANLIRDVRRDYLRELIHFRGRLKFVRTVKPTQILKAGGIDTLYEGWVVPNEETNLLCFLFSELPKNIPTDVEINETIHVKLNGYFFKLMQYESLEKNTKGGQVWRRAPLLIGHTLTVFTPGNSNPGVSDFKALASIALGSFLVVIFILVLFFRFSDRKVRESPTVQGIQKNPFDERSEIEIDRSNNSSMT